MQSKESKTTQKGQDLSEALKDAEFKSSANYGATEDILDYKKLFGLFFAGIIIVSVLVYTAMVMFNYLSFKTSQEAAVNAVFYDLEDLRAKDKEILTTFGVVNDENGVYRVPVDSAVTLILNDYAR